MLRKIPVTDLQADYLRPYFMTAETQLVHYYEPDPLGLFIAESPKVIARAIAAGYVPESVLCSEELHSSEAEAVFELLDDTPVYLAAAEQIATMRGFALTGGMLAVMRRQSCRSIDEVCQNARRIAVLEDVVNPTNVGAIMRSAAALNMDAVLLTPNCADPLYRRAARVSMGTVFQVPWTYLPCETNYVELLHQLHFQTAAMALCDDSVSLSDPRLQVIEKLAVILGTEGAGLRQETIVASDYTVRIPMSHGVDSLNVAAASAVAFWQLGLHS